MSSAIDTTAGDQLPAEIAPARVSRLLTAAEFHTPDLRPQEK